MSNSVVQVLVLLMLSAALLAALGAEGRGLCFQSPPSPVPPVAPGGLPIVRADPASSLRSAARSSRLFSQSLWSSPLPWVAIGVVLFASVAWALTTLISWLEPPQAGDASDKAIEAILSPQEGLTGDGQSSGQA